MNVFLVLTPLQLINALEAKHHFATKDNVLIVLRHTSLGYPISMFKRLVDEKEWDRIYYLSTYDDELTKRVHLLHYTYLTLRQRQRLNRLANKLSSVKRLFIGQYHEPIARHLSNILHYETLYLLDDGTSTLETNNERNAPAQHPLQGNLKAKLKHILLGINDREAKQLTFFTAYDIEPRPGDEVVVNRYAYFQKLVASVPFSDEIWFLGEPLVVDGYVTEATYLRYLAQIRHHFKKQRFVYLPHSREQSRDVDRISTLLNCEVRRFGIPVEFALRDTNPRPRDVASFISSALPNCRIMFGQTLQLTAVRLFPEHILDRGEFVARVYEHFQEISDHDFGVLDLDGITP